MESVGRPREHDRDELLANLLKYIAETTIPIVSEFAYQNGLHRQQLYDMPELSDALKICITKKEAALESLGLSGAVNTTMAIFSLKQIGWRDTQSLEHTGKDGKDLIPSRSPQDLSDDELAAIVGSGGSAGTAHPPTGSD